MRYDLRVKSFFFDRQRVIDAMSKATRGALSQIGAFIRKSAQQSMGKGKESAKPGKPPNIHEGSLKRLLYFSFDPQSRSVVIGPVAFRKPGIVTTSVSTIPNLLEFGGQATIKRKNKNVRANYRPHPFMAPALEREQKNEKLASAWANSVKA